MSELAKLAWPQVKSLLAQGCAAILPVGATEAHGPHLPLDTDVTIARGMARRAAAVLMARGRACVVLPPVSYAVAEFAAPFAGTLSLPRETAIAHLRDVLCSATRAGFAPLAVANAHLEPAHIDTVRRAIDEAAERDGTAIVFPDVTRRELAARLGEEFRSGACHAGRYETSLVLAEDADSVQDEQRRKLPAVDVSLVDAIREGKTDFLQAGAPQAYCGDPARASIAEGATRLDVLADILVEALEQAAGQ